MTAPVSDLLSVEVHLFGRYREMAPGARLTVEMRTGATVADFVASLHDRFPGSFPLRPFVAVNRSLARDADVIDAGDEVALIPAVAGG